MGWISWLESQAVAPCIARGVHFAFPRRPKIIRRRGSNTEAARQASTGAGKQGVSFALMITLRMEMRGELGQHGAVIVPEQDELGDTFSRTDGRRMVKIFKRPGSNIEAGHQGVLDSGRAGEP